MKDPGLSGEEYLRDRVLARETVFGSHALARLTGASSADGSVTFRAPQRLEIRLPCGARLSRFNSLSVTVLNRSGMALLAGVNLVHEGKESDSGFQPISVSGGREPLPSGTWTRLHFPCESFGTYGTPQGWNSISRIELFFGREKTETGTCEICVSIGSIDGEYREVPKGPRLTDQGLIRVMGEAVAGAAGCFEKTCRPVPTTPSPPPGANSFEPYTIRNIALHIPPPHPYPREDADDVLEGRIMGQRLSHPLGWNANPTGVLEWSHFLHRHHFLRQVVRALGETGDKRYGKYIEEAIVSWIVENPVPVSSNGGAGPAWETLSAAWRLREWLWAMGIGWPGGAFPGDAKRLMMRSGWEHARSLMDNRGHPNNWIIVESAALALAGMYFPEFRESSRWTEEGIARLRAELRNQLFADGVHFEISPLYHAICFYAFLEVKCAALSRKKALPAELDESPERFADYLASLCRPDFTWPSLNDSGGIGEDFTVLMLKAGEVFHRPDLIWIGSRGKHGHPPPKTSRVFADSGIVIMRSGYGKGANHLVFRAGPPGAAHSHGDALSLDVTVAGEPRLVDPGISTYAPCPISSWYRSAAAHNMILVDGKGPDYSRMDFPARILPAHDNIRFLQNDRLEAATGISRCYGSTGPGDGECIVARTVIFIDHEYWIVRDDVTGCGTSKMDVCWQFSPGKVKLDMETLTVHSEDDRGKGLKLMALPGALRPRIEVCSGMLHPPRGWVSVGGRDLPATHIRFALAPASSMSMIWILLPWTGGNRSVPEPASREEGKRGDITVILAHADGRKDHLVIPRPDMEKDFFLRFSRYR